MVSFFLIIDLCFLIPEVITQAFILIAELVIPIRISVKKQNKQLKYIQ